MKGYGLFLSGKFFPSLNRSKVNSRQQLNSLELKDWSFYFVDVNLPFIRIISTQI